MLKVKDNIKLVETLKKYGFHKHYSYGAHNEYFEYYYSLDGRAEISVNPSRELEIVYPNSDEYGIITNLDILFDLIKDGILEKD